MIHLILANYSGYTLKSLLDEVTLIQLLVMASAIKRNKTLEYLTTICGIRVATQASQNEWENYVNSIQNGKDIKKQLTSLKNVKGFSIQKK